ncbi:MAG TPA: hypothetical protein DCK87_03530 [Desulfotomaculum sp.]|nr:hypothetical protein [Desulfotomaculum sp.]
MHFLFSQALWLALSIPAILLLYVLRPRRQQKVVPSLFLWRRSISPQQATRPWQRLQPHILLWLQLLAAALLTLGAAAPIWYLTRPAPNTIVLLDASASMQATDLGKTRFEAALKEIEAMALELKKDARLTVIVFDRQPRVVVNKSYSYSEVKRALRELKPSYSSGELGPALSLARAMARGQSQPRLILLSDGGLRGLEEQKGSLEFRPVGSPEAVNVALASLSLRPTGTGQAALVVVVNHSNQTASGRIQLTVGEKTLPPKAFQLAPEKSTSLLWSDLTAGLPIRARLQLTKNSLDHFPLDNQIWAVPQETGPRKVLLVTKGNLFLEKMLSVLPSLEVYKINPEKYLSLLKAGYPYDLTILDGLSKPLPPGAVFFLNPPPGEIIKELFVGEEIKPGKLTLNPESSLTSYVDFSQVHVAKARTVKPKNNWVKDIAWAERVIMTHGSESGRRVAVLGFNLNASDLPLRPAFPVLTQNIIYWLLPPQMELTTQVTPGEEVKINALPLAVKITITGPEDTSTNLAPPFPPSPWVPVKPGLYKIIQTLKEEQVNHLVAVNGYLEQEANLAVKAIPPGIEKTGGIADKEPFPVPFAQGLALLALLTVLVEWGVASRGR